jgi:glycine oxidase
VKTWDVVIIGGGVIGLSLAWRLRKASATVLIIEKGEPAREATAAAGGMLADCDPGIPPEMRAIATESAKMYPGFARELQAEAFQSPDLREHGTIAYLSADESRACRAAKVLSEAEVAELEPSLAPCGPAYLLPERSIDPRKLGRALDKAGRTLGVDLVSGSPATEVATLGGRAIGVRTAKSFYTAGAVVNCAGAWASQIKPLGVPTRPVKGQMVCLIPQAGEKHAAPLVQHVIRTPQIYIIPRTDGRILLGATVEEAGYEKRVDPDKVKRFTDLAIAVVPEIAKMRFHDAWAGLRPGSPDGLPILGATSLKGYFAATGHFRDGILLAPISALLMLQVLKGRKPDFDMAPFSPQRFG